MPPMIPTVLLVLVTPIVPQAVVTPTNTEALPNVILILADDLGWGEIGAYGQEKIRTPNLDRLASEGMRFTQFYSGSPVCAPARFVLLTGLHTGHAYVRGNKEMGGWGPDEPEGQLPMQAETVTLAEVLREKGHATCAVGKWGLGGPASSGHPLHQGFDRFYGLLCQRVAHNHYPTHLWRNHDVDVLDGNRWFSAHQRLEAAPDSRAGEGEDAIWARYVGARYAPDAMIEEALDFVRTSAARPFFLYFATPVPHAALQVPRDSLDEYSGRFDLEPYLGERGYLPHPEPRAGYAAMVTRMDRDIGRLLDLLVELDLVGRTVVLFTSDNGPTFNGGTDSEFFRSSGAFRGRKTTLWEGGIRVPLIVRWPDRVAPGVVNDHVGAFQDLLPTLADCVGTRPPAGIDGISMLPTLTGDGEQLLHEDLYWEFPEGDGQQALRRGRWKVLRRGLHQGSTPAELYDLQEDPGETHDLAAEHPELVAELSDRMRCSRTPSDLFPIDGLDNP
jgi:arylsulfatase